MRRGSNNAASPENLLTALETLHEFNLGGCDVDFTPQKHTGSKYVDLTILTADSRVRP